MCAAAETAALWSSTMTRSIERRMAGAASRIFLTTSFALAQPAENAIVSKELQAYYRTGKEPPWADTVKKLTAAKPDERAAAAKFAFRGQ